MNKNIHIDLLIFMSVMGVAIFASSIVSPVLPLYLASIGVSPELIGLLFSFETVAFAVGELSWGTLADRIGFRIVLLSSSLAAILSFALFLASKTPAILFLAFFLLGLAVASAFLAGRGYVGITATPRQKTYFMAIILAVASAARSLGSALSGWIVKDYGYPAVFSASLWFSVAAVVIFLVLFRKVDAAIPARRQRESAVPGERPMFRQLRSYRSAVIQGLIAAMIFIGYGIVTAFLSLFAAEAAGAGTNEVGLLFAILWIVNGASAFPFANLANRLGKEVSILLGLLASALSLAAIALLPVFSWLVVAVVVFSLGRTIFGIAALALISDTLPPHRQGIGLGFYGVCEDSGIFMGSALGGFIWSTVNPQATFLFGSLSAALGALLSLSLIKARRASRRAQEGQAT